MNNILNIIQPSSELLYCPLLVICSMPPGSTYPEPLYAFHLVPPHHTPSEEFGLLCRYRFAVHSSVWIQHLLAVLPQSLRQPAFNIRVCVTQLLYILSFQFY